MNALEMMPRHARNRLKTKFCKKMNVLRQLGDCLGLPCANAWSKVSVPQTGKKDGRSKIGKRENQARTQRKRSSTDHRGPDSKKNPRARQRDSPGFSGRAVAPRQCSEGRCLLLNRSG